MAKTKKAGSKTKKLPLPLLEMDYPTRSSNEAEDIDWVKFAMDIKMAAAKHFLPDFATLERIRSITGLPVTTLHRARTGLKVEAQAMLVICLVFGLNPTDYLEAGK